VDKRLVKMNQDTFLVRKGTKFARRF